MNLTSDSECLGKQFPESFPCLPRQLGTGQMWMMDFIFEVIYAYRSFIMKSQKYFRYRNYLIKVKSVVNNRVTRPQGQSSLAQIITPHKAALIGRSPVQSQVRAWASHQNFPFLLTNLTYGQIWERKGDGRKLDKSSLYSRREGSKLDKSSPPEEGWDGIQYCYELTIQQHWIPSHHSWGGLLLSNLLPSSLL